MSMLSIIIYATFEVQEIPWNWGFFVARWAMKRILSRDKPLSDFKTRAILST